MAEVPFEFFDGLLGRLVSRKHAVVDDRWSDRAGSDAAYRQQRKLFIRSCFAGFDTGCIFQRPLALFRRL